MPVENFQTTTGEPTNAVYGFTSMLINIVRDEKPTHIAVAFDVSRQTFRAAEYADYKGQRESAPPEFKSQIPLIEQVLDAMNIAYFKKDGYEADDIIGTLATQANHAGWEVLIATGDRDSMQLVNDKTTVLYPRKGVSDLARMTPEAVEEKYLVPPAQYPELAALVGETSDNLPGVPGVGPKTAAKWLKSFGSLDELLARMDEVPGKVGESLRAHVDDVVRNRRLNALVLDLDIGANLDDLGHKSPNREAVHQLFDTLQFRALRDRLFALQPAVAEPETVSASITVAGSILQPGEITAWLAEHGQGVTGLHALGVFARGTGEIDGFAFASADGAAAYLDVTTITPEDDATVAAWLADDTKLKAMHDAKGPIEAMIARGWAFAGLSFDTELAAYLLRPDQRSYELSDLSIRHLQKELPIAETDQLFDDTAHESAMAMAAAIVELSATLTTELDKSVSLLTEMEIPLLAILADMEIAGIAVDVEYLDNLESEFGAKAMEAAQAAYKEIGREVNLGSPKQLQTVLFDDLGLPKTKKTKTGYTTDAEALQKLYVERPDVRFLEYLLAHRDVTKLRQTVEGLRKSVSDDGRVHTTFQQTIAATGRLSSKDPNLQNIPIRTESGRRIRAAFTVGAGYESLMSADYSQIEMRIMAHLSDDHDVIEAFKSGEDFHTFMAAKVFEVDPDDVTTELRSRIKAMNYGLAYGLSAYGLSQQLSITPGEAQTLMDEYFARFGGVRDYLHGIVDEARRTGYTATMFGRRRYLPDLNSDNRQRREMAERMALNAPIQGSAADLIKRAMISLHHALNEAELSSRILLQVHDELVLEIAAGEREQVEELVRTHMGTAADLKVPLDVSVGVGRTWFDAAH